MHLPYSHKHFDDIDKLWIVAVVSNPQRYHARYELFHRFRRHMEQSGVNLMVVEGAFGERPHEITEHGNPRHVQVRLTEEMWHKESLINLGVSRIPSDWKYVAWIDADVGFLREDWATETVHQLQHYDVIQMFEHAIDLGPEGEPMACYDSFMSCWQKGKPRYTPSPDGDPYYEAPKGPYWHSGFAWAARRDAWNAMGGLMDWPILGSADHHMAWALIGEVESTYPGSVSESYLRRLKTWQDRVSVGIRRNVGYMPGTIQHHWHGKKKDRRYRERWSVLKEHQYDPDQDIQRDWQGVYTLSHKGERMRNDLRAYFRQRNEDSIDR